VSSNEALKILHITDPHLHADSDTELYGFKTYHSFRAVIQRALNSQQWRPAAVLVTGDIVEDRSRQGYQHFRSVLEPLGLPILCLPGNHDDPALMRQQLSGGDFSFCECRDIDRWRLIQLNSHVAGDEGGELNASELVRLELELADAGDRFVLVSVHHQPIPMGSAWIDNFGLRNGPDLLSIVERHGHAKGIVWGHVHQASDRQHGKLRMLSTPSTCAQFTPFTERCVMDTRPPGFRRINLEADGNISTEVLWLKDWSVAERPPDSRAREKHTDPT
jgi:Icc protein